MLLTAVDLLSVGYPDLDARVDEAIRNWERAHPFSESVAATLAVWPAEQCTQFASEIARQGEELPAHVSPRTADGAGRMSRLPNPPRQELLEVGEFVNARMLEAQTTVAGRRHTRAAVPEPVTALVDAALASSRAMLAEMLADMDPGDNRIRAIAAPLYEMAEQWKNHPRFQPAWRARRLDTVSAQPKPAHRRARTS